MVPRLGFLHIPKCAGRSIRHAFGAWFPDGGIYIIRDYQQPNVPYQAQFVTGHFYYDNFPPGDRRVVCTVLRHPVERIVSYYEMCKASDREQWGKARLFWQDNQPMPLRTFAADALDMAAQLDNAMVRHLAGSYTLQGDHRVGERDLERAWRNLQTLVYGFIDQLPRFMLDVAECMGKRPRRLAHINGNTYHDTASAEDKDFIADINSYDIMLYERAQEFYDAR